MFGSALEQLKVESTAKLAHLKEQLQKQTQETATAAAEIQKKREELRNLETQHAPQLNRIKELEATIQEVDTYRAAFEQVQVAIANRLGKPATVKPAEVSGKVELAP